MPSYASSPSTSYSYALPQPPPSIYGRLHRTTSRHSHSSTPKQSPPTDVDYLLGTVQGVYIDAKGRAHDPDFKLFPDPAVMMARRDARDLALSSANSNRESAYVRPPSREEIFPTAPTSYAWRASLELPPTPPPRFTTEPEFDYQKWAETSPIFPGMFAEEDALKEKETAEQYVPTCGDAIRRQWSYFMLRIRFAILQQQRKWRRPRS